MSFVDIKMHGTTINKIHHCSYSLRRLNFTFTFTLLCTVKMLMEMNSFRIERNFTLMALIHLNYLECNVT